jgi:hypothetical protein
VLLLLVRLVPALRVLAMGTRKMPVVTFSTFTTCTFSTCTLST